MTPEAEECEVAEGSKNCRGSGVVTKLIQGQVSRWDLCGEEHLHFSHLASFFDGGLVSFVLVFGLLRVWCFGFLVGSLFLPPTN